MQDKYFPLNFAPKYVRPSVNQETQEMMNQTIWSQTEAFITKSCEVCALLTYSIRTYVSWQHISPSFNGQEVQKRVESMKKVNWHNLQQYINNQQNAL
jgi:hypothetical protein